MGEEPTKAELEEQARELDIAGRSSMNKEELAAAIADATTAEAEEPEAVEEQTDEAPAEAEERVIDAEEQAELDRRAAVVADNDRRQVRLGRV